MMEIKHIPFLLLAGGLCVNVQASDPVLTEQDLIYTNDQMLNFNIEDYLRTYAPHLLPYAESISHWAGFSTISPKILIALMEQQSSIVSIESSESMSRPFGILSDKTGFDAQLRDICERLADFHYTRSSDSNQLSSIAKLLTAQYTLQAASTSSTSELIRKLSSAYYQLFPADIQLAPSTQIQQGASTEVGAAADLPASNLLQLPYPVGSSWRFGGSHSNTGAGSVYSSLDFFDGGYWGDNLSNLWVTAAAPGTVVVHSSCNMEIIHADGWSTQYYHLDNIQYSDGDSVARDANIANYASDENQALCEGGFSTGPHVHFSLKRNGSSVSLQDVALSGFTVNVGSSNYDTDCNRFYLYADDGAKKCAGYPLYNPGVSDYNPPDPTPRPTPTPSPVTTILENGVVESGLTGVVNTELMFAIDVPANATNLEFQMNGGTGDADLYVRFGTEPTLNSYDCRPYHGNSDETCQISNVQEGRYYALIHAYTAISGTSLVASYDGAPVPEPTPEPTPTPTLEPTPIPEPTPTPDSGYNNWWERFFGQGGWQWWW